MLKSVFLFIKTRDYIFKDFNIINFPFNLKANNVMYELSITW